MYFLLLVYNHLHANHMAILELYRCKALTLVSLSAKLIHHIEFGELRAAYGCRLRASDQVWSWNCCGSIDCSDRYLGFSSSHRNPRLSLMAHVCFDLQYSWYSRNAVEHRAHEVDVGPRTSSKMAGCSRLEVHLSNQIPLCGCFHSYFFSVRHPMEDSRLYATEAIAFVWESHSPYSFLDHHTPSLSEGSCLSGLDTRHALYFVTVLSLVLPPVWLGFSLRPLHEAESIQEWTQFLDVDPRIDAFWPSSQRRTAFTFPPQSSAAGASPHWQLAPWSSSPTSPLHTTSVSIPQAPWLSKPSSTLSLPQCIVAVPAPFQFVCISGVLTISIRSTYGLSLRYYPSEENPSSFSWCSLPVRGSCCDSLIADFMSGPDQAESLLSSWGACFDCLFARTCSFYILEICGNCQARRQWLSWTACLCNIFYSRCCSRTSSAYGYQHIAQMEMIHAVSLSLSLKDAGVASSWGCQSFCSIADSSSLCWLFQLPFPFDSSAKNQPSTISRILSQRCQGSSAVVYSLALVICIRLEKAFSEKHASADGRGQSSPT